MFDFDLHNRKEMLSKRSKKDAERLLYEWVKVGFLSLKHFSVLYLLVAEKV